MKKRNKARLREPQAMREIRRVRARILKKAHKAGVANYYLGLNQRDELVLTPAGMPTDALRESAKAYRAQVSEPQGVRDVRQWRERIRNEMDEIGFDEYMRLLNERTAELFRPPKKRSSRPRRKV